MFALCLALAFAQEDPALPKGPAGWKVELAARAHHPTVLCASPDGRLFVGEDPQDMEGPVDQPIGRVLCIRPDGKVTLFAEKLGAVFGIAYLDGKVYVHHVPKLTAWRDDDGVGRDPVDVIACTHPEPSRANRYNTHIPAGFRLAMDGYFYMAVGDKGLQGTVVHKGGGVVRFRPDGTGLEVVASGTRNIMDLAVNDEDELFAWDNDDNVSWGARVLHLVEGGDYGYPWDRGKPWTLGAMFEGRGIPAGAIAHGGDLYFCEWGRSQIIRMKIEREGASWKLVSREALFSKGAAEFRPVGIALLPGGNGFAIADWNTASRLRAEEAGRVLRLSSGDPVSRPAWYVPAAMGRPFDAGDDALLEGLRHPDRDVRLTAQRRLADRHATGPLEALLRDRSAPARARVHALWALDPFEAGRDAIPAAASDPDPLVRRQAIRAVGIRRGAVPPRTLADPDPSVRFHAATAMGRASRREAVPALLDLLDDRDPSVRHAARCALGRIGDWKATGPRGIAAMHGAYDEIAVSILIEESARRPEAVTILAELHRRETWEGSWWGTRPALNPKPPKPDDWSCTARIGQAIRMALAIPATRRAAVDAVRAISDREAIGPLHAAFRAAGAEARRAILEALSALKDPDVGPLAVEAFQGGDVAAAPLVPDAGLLSEAAAREKDGANVLLIVGELSRRSAPAPASLLRHPDAAVRRAALDALGRAGSFETVETALADPEVRTDAIAALARRPQAKYLEAYREGLDGRNPVHREACRRAVGALAPEVLAEYDRKVRRPGAAEFLDHALKNPGDAARGRELFWDPQALACSRCHAVGGKGGDIGPELTMTGAIYGREYLAESVVYPGKVIQGGYRQAVVRTKDGSVHTGIVRRETREELSLLDPEGNVRTVRKVEIEARKTAETSLMPEGLVSGLTLQEFADLVSYLQSLRAEE